MLENVQEINGIKYAYTEEGEFNTLYIAECREFDENFITKFYGKSDYSEEQLMEIGNGIAQIWGAKCLKVKKLK